MTSCYPHAAHAAWRPACPADLEPIAWLSRRVHPDYPERPQVFADRLALHPTGVLLATIGDAPAGYAIGHPWRGPAPLLDRCLDVLPDRPDSYWIHDVALLETARGSGLGRAAVSLLRDDAGQYGLRHLRLVAVGRAGSFWRRAGFVAVPDALPACYGEGATAMQQLWPMEAHAERP